MGLFIALFGVLIVRWATALVWPGYGFTATVCKETSIWLCVVVLFVVIRCGEGMPLSSIGLRTAPVSKSILWGILLAVVCMIVGGIVASLTHFKGGDLGAALFKLPLWLALLVVVRAGLVEELFYRGYAIERLQLLGLNRYLAGTIPLLIFGFAHLTNGWANVIIALALGAVLTVFYLWRRDLVANIIGHFLVDFISIVLPRLLAHS
ncbi:MAG TPA: type II CAAX endopeptidase family protein [Chthoniobacterales bacterium]|nr:type II CAAX endopeptidase family protein [Chthoniobacterales bacterium]